MINFVSKPMKQKINVTQKWHEKLIFEFLCLPSVLFWIALHLFHLTLWLYYLYDASRLGFYQYEFHDI